MTIDIPDYQRLKLILESDIDITNRVIYLITDIDSESAETVIKSLDFLSSTSNELITIKISTYGGDPYAGFAIHDAIRKCTCPVATVTTGMCMSAGVLVAAAGDAGKRYSHPNTQWMYHSGSEGYAGEINNFTITADHLRDFQETCIDAITSRTKKRRKFWKDLEDKATDTYFKSKEAKSWGVVDHITEIF